MSASAHGRRGPGRFVTFEGIEGSGKSTQIERLARRLEAAGRDVVRTHEPGGTALGRRLRAALLDPDGSSMAPLAEMLLYAADRAQHVSEVVRPGLERGAVVLSDRYLDATLAYQGYGRRLGTEVVLAIHAHPPLDLRPERTVLLDLDPVTAVSRARLRNAERGVAETEGRFEDEDLTFHRRVRQGYLELARDDPERYRVVDAGGVPDEVARRVHEAVADLFPTRGAS
jgi:dTMP kinase